MGVKLINDNSPGTILMKDMPDGAIGVITGGPNDGRVVQMLRAGYSVSPDCIFSIGLPNGNSWSSPSGTNSIRVRLLEPGEGIEITA